MKNVDEAYNCIATNLAEKADGNWAKIVFQTKVLGNVCSSMMSIAKYLEKDDLSFGLGITKVFEVSDASIFLRDNLLARTGERIWGLTFTLYPDGKFKIEYDYNKPEGYEETDETISMDDAIKGLSDFK